MSTSRSRSASVREDEELRLPRAPGVIRRFWARHPVAADVLIAVLCAVITIVPAGTISLASTGVLPLISPASSAIFLVLVLGACALLLRRRQWPIRAFAGSIAVAVLSLLSAVPVSGPLILVTSYSLAVYHSSRAAWRALAISLLALTAIAFALERSGTITFEAALNGVVNELVLGLIGTLVGVNVGNSRRYIEAVIGRSRQLLVERDQHAQLATAAERARIAREMHDIVSHSLTVIVALSEGAAATSDHEKARAASTTAAATARGALTEMRAMLGVLRDDDSPAPLAPMAPTPPQETVATAQRAGFPVTLSTIGDPDVSPAVGHAIGRIVQEGVTNAIRHAPAATAIAVRLEYTPDEVIIEIVNDAAAGPVGTKGFGLRGLSERATHVHGTLSSGPAAGSRWVLRAELPAGVARDAAGVDSTEVPE